MCEFAITAAEAESKLPAHVLNAISLRESGRLDPETGRVRPWPWTINYQGAGHFYASKADAIEAVQEIQAAGGQSIDVGCMQVNLQQHPNAFANLDDAFDPTRNASYAGRFLTALFGDFHDWGPAIAAYHSRTPGIGEPYRDQVVATWNPKDPAVLAKLTFAPLPMTSGGALPGLPLIYVPFAEPGPVRIGASSVYRAFAAAAANYRDFRTASVVYADFAARRPVKAFPAVHHGRALDLRLDQGLVTSGRALVAPKGVVERVGARPVVVKPAATKPRDG
jgi:hypothetical protein